SGGLGSAAGGAALAAAPSSSITTSTLPTGQMSPSLKLILTTVPARGDGSSTVALSVITSTSGWSSLTLSPSLTFQETTSPSTTPSPMSGMKKLKAISPLQCLANRAHDAIGIGQVLELEAVRERRVEPGHPEDGRLEVLHR